MRITHRAALAALGALLLAACAGRPGGAPSPARAAAELTVARADFASHPSNDAARLRLGRALVGVGNDDEAISTLAPLTSRTDETAGIATLWTARAAEHKGDLAAARTGYERYLMSHRDADVEAHLGEVRRREADVVIRTAIANERALNPSGYPEQSVGVAPLTAVVTDTTLSALGYGMADLLITDLAQSAKLKVVDRIEVDALMRELKLASSDRIDSATAPRVGLLMGARRMVNGVVAQTAQSHLDINARVTDVQKADYVGRPITASISIKEILDAEKALAFRLFEQLGVTLTPAERGRVEQRPTRYLAAFLAYAKGVRDEAAGRFDAANQNYSQALSIDPSFTQAARHRAAIQLRVTRATSLASTDFDRPIQSLLDALVPSPAGTLGNLRDRGGDNAISTFGTSASGSIVIIINILPPTP